MIIPYTPSALWSDSINLYDDEELLTPSAALFRTPEEAALDRTQLLHDKLIGDIIETDSIVRSIPIGTPEGTPSRFAHTGYTWLQTDITDTGSLDFEFTPPYEGAILIAVLARFNGKQSGVSHVAWPPADRVRLAVFRVTDGSSGAIGFVDDALAKVAYEVPHDLLLSLGGAAHFAAYNDRFVARFAGESGANAEVNQVALLSMRAQWSKTPV